MMEMPLPVRKFVKAEKGLAVVGENCKKPREKALK
jgi:hypothetical protein